MLAFCKSLFVYENHVRPDHRSRHNEIERDASVANKFHAGMAWNKMYHAWRFNNVGEEVGFIHVIHIECFHLVSIILCYLLNVKKEQCLCRFVPLNGKHPYARARACVTQFRLLFKK